ncbi:hypothetical protein RJD28_11495 [Oscillospiraceae bacterium NTUH-002-81]|nr:hypothetical protein RJD28_11495 [Oscillospiraceae bacterium NTUH-002-81]
MKNEVYRRGHKASYTDRPLTMQEQKFAEEHHDLIYRYMRKHQLYDDEWYNCLSYPYLQAVKKYHEYEYLQTLKFEQICYRTLDSARSNYFRAMNRKMRKPEGGLFSYDTMISDNDNSTMECFLRDTHVDIENEIAFKEMFREFYEKCIYCESDSWGDSHINGYLKCELDLLLEGCTRIQANKRTEKVFPYGYTVDDLDDDIKEFRRIFRQVFGI